MTEQKAKDLEHALKLRQRIKRKKPKFVRPESWRYHRLKENWRKPQGLDHKMRIKYAGWPPTVSVGYRGPKATRGLHPSGYMEVLAHNAEELKNVDPKTQAVRIGHTVGKRKRAQILAEAKKKRITVLNIKQVKEVIPEEKRETEEGKLEEEEVSEKLEDTEKPKRKRGNTRKRTKGTD